MTPEFSRLLNVARVPRGGSYEKISAEPSECLALAKRLDVPAIHALNAEMRATPWRGGGLKLEGFLKADVEQVSVVSLEAFRHHVEFPILLFFMAGKIEANDEDAEVDPIIDSHLDLGEVVAETLALELDPYPRKPGEDFDEVIAEPKAEVTPFAALAKLKPK